MSSSALPGGHFAGNLLHFGRLLRDSGLPVSTSQIGELARALTRIELASRVDFYHTARSLLVTHAQHYPAFDRAFELFWSGREAWLVGFALGQAAATAEGPSPDGNSSDPPLLADENANLESDVGPPDDGEPVVKAQPIYSAVERLRQKNFAAYSAAEKELLRQALQQLVWQFQERQTRRLRRAHKRAPYLDLRRSLRANSAHGGEIIHLRWRRRKTKPRPLVVICDISGSMDRYSRVFLQFIHSLSQGLQKVEAFAFGTRLTRLTPALRYNDVDTAVDKIADLVVDWSGGTRIGQSLRTFNYQWGRRVLGRGAVVMIISDGWERGDLDLLRGEMDRLRRSSHRLIWLNPLAGTPGYAPLVGGIRTALPFCDEFLPLHNLASVEQLIARLGRLSVA